MFGREARLPIDLTRVKHAKEQQEELSFTEKLEKMLDMQKSLHDQARQNIQEAQERQKRQYDAKHNSRTTLKVGDKVLVQEMKNEGRKGGKLDVQFRGPYSIVETLGKGRFRLQDQSGATLKKSVNCHRLKLWLESDGGRLQPPRKRKSPDEANDTQQTKKRNVRSYHLYIHVSHVCMFGNSLKL